MLKRHPRNGEKRPLPLRKECLWSHSMLDLQPRSSGDLGWVALKGVEGGLAAEVGMWVVCMTEKPSRVLRREQEMGQKQVTKPSCKQV